MAFTGTLDKCKACDQTIYVVDMLSLEGQRKRNMMRNYSSMDGVLHYKTHLEQLFKESGNFSKNFQGAKAEKTNYQMSKIPSKLSFMFSGTQDKCSTCSKTVYPLEKVTLEGECYHKTCFRCAHAGSPLTHSNYAALDGNLYCKATLPSSSWRKETKIMSSRLPPTREPLPAPPHRHPRPRTPSRMRKHQQLKLLQKINQRISIK